MREIRIAQISIFEAYSEHDISVQLKNLGNLLDAHPETLPLIKKDLAKPSLKPAGRTGLTVENVFRCLLLKQRLSVSYKQLTFHLSDSMSYRSFARLAPNQGAQEVGFTVDHPKYYTANTGSGSQHACV